MVEACFFVCSFLITLLLVSIHPNMQEDTFAIDKLKQFSALF